MQLFVENDILTFSLDERVDYNIASSYEKLIQTCQNSSFNIFHLNFEKTGFVTLPGAIYLVFMAHEVVNSKKAQSEFVKTEIVECPDKITFALLNFGFFNALKLYGNLNTSPDFDRTSIEQITYWKRVVTNLDPNLKRLYWPIANIPLKHGNRFELEAHNFVNGFIDFFTSVIRLGFLNNLSNEDLDFIERFFIKAINESTKNVWDHSESWGVAAIQSSTYTNTTFCLFDFGIGFIKSYIKRKGEFLRSNTADKNVLKWLFEEGNTSNEGTNHGHGLSILQKFTDLSGGVLLINTDRYGIQYSKTKGLIIKEKTFFPGTQIMFNF